MRKYYDKYLVRQSSQAAGYTHKRLNQSTIKTNKPDNLLRLCRSIPQLCVDRHYMVWCRSTHHLWCRSTPIAILHDQPLPRVERTLPWCRSTPIAQNASSDLSSAKPPITNLTEATKAPHNTIKQFTSSEFIKSSQQSHKTYNHRDLIAQISHGHALTLTI